MRPRRWQGKYGMYIIIISYIFLGAIHTIGYLRSIDEKVYTSLDRSQTDLSSHSSVRMHVHVHVQIAFDLDRFQINLTH